MTDNGPRQTQHGLKYGKKVALELALEVGIVSGSRYNENAVDSICDLLEVVQD